MNNTVKVNVVTNYPRLMNSLDSCIMAIWVLDEGTPIGMADGQFWGMYGDMHSLSHLVLNNGILLPTRPCLSNKDSGVDLRWVFLTKWFLVRMFHAWTLTDRYWPGSNRLTRSHSPKRAYN